MSTLNIQCWNIERINLPKTSKYIAEFCHRLNALYATTRVDVNILLENKTLPDDVLQTIRDTLNRSYDGGKWQTAIMSAGGIKASSTAENFLVLYRADYQVELMVDDVVKYVKNDAMLNKHFQVSVDGTGQVTSAYRIPGLFALTVGRQEYKIGMYHAPGPQTDMAPFIVNQCLNALGGLNAHVVLGDFNCYGSTGVQPSPFKSADSSSKRGVSYAWVGDNLGTTFKRVDGVCIPEFTNSPLDRVFVNRNFDLEVEVGYIRDTGIHHYSDHIPVYAKITLPYGEGELVESSCAAPSRSRVSLAGLTGPPMRTLAPTRGDAPDLSRIAALFKPGTVVLDDLTLGTTGFNTIAMTSGLRADQIALAYSGSTPQPSGKKLEVSAHWTVLEESGLQVAATFWATDAGLALAISATIPGSWQLQSAFPDMQDDALGTTELSSARLIFTYGQIPTDEPLSRFNATPGLHLSAQLPLDDSGPCNWLAPIWGSKLPDAALLVEGSIAYDTIGLLVDLYGQLPTSPPLPLLGFTVTGALRALFNGGEQDPDRGALPSSGSYVGGVLRKTAPPPSLAGTPPPAPGGLTEIPAFIAWLPQRSAATTSTDPAGMYLITLGDAAAPIVNLDDLVPLFGGAEASKEWQQLLPDIVRQWLSTLNLQSLAFGITCGATLDLPYVAVQVALASPVELFTVPVFDTPLTLNWLSLTLIAESPFAEAASRSFGVDLLSAITIGTNERTFALEVLLPDMVIGGSLQLDETASLKGIVAEFAGASAATLPDDLATLTADHVDVLIDYPNQQYSCEVFFSLELLGIAFNGASCCVTYDAKSKSFTERALGGYIKVGPVSLGVGGVIGGVIGDGSTTPTEIAITWSAADSGESLTLTDVLADLDLGLQFPDGLDFSLEDVKFSYTCGLASGSRLLSFEATTEIGGEKVTAVAIVLPGESASESRKVLVLDVPVPPVFGGLPVVGSAPLPISQLQIVAASADLSADLDDLNATLCDLGATSIPSADALKGGTCLCLLFEGSSEALTFPLTGTPSASMEAAAARPRTGPSSDGQSTMLWKNLQSTVGPLFFSRIGISWQNGGISLVLDCALIASGLQLSLQGFYISFPLNDPTNFSFGLDGLGIEYTSGPVRIGGGFVDDDGSYTGPAVIQMPELSLTAFGGYTKVDGHPSLFVYGLLDDPQIGGPAFFFVTGVAVGFGYNRRLLIPTIAEVEGFPLVAAADPTSPESRKSFTDIASDLDRVIPPFVGDSWVAAGIRFTSFELVHSFALLTVEFGAKTEITVLGRSSVSIPSDIPLLHAAVVLEASYAPDEGILRVDGTLTSDSYLLSTDCHLVGGFALYAWFKDQPGVTKAGDFVVTIGGYPNDFVAPSHYPTVPRLGLYWQLSSEISITGQEYAALTPSCVMAGGSLSIVFHVGGLRAWFDAEVDFFMNWKPYRYDFRISVDVGVSFSFTIPLLFCSVNVTLEASTGAGMHIWGPDFTGDVRVEVVFISFTIGFGSGATKGATIPWSEFATSFLPDDPSKVCTIRLTDGGVRSVTTSEGVSWVVDANRLEMLTHCLIPSTNAATHVGAAFGVRPVGLRDDGTLKSTHTVTVTRDGVDRTSHFSFDAVTENVPKALWGGPGAEGADADPLQAGALTGLRVTALVQTISPDQTPSVAIDNLLVQAPSATIHAIAWSPVPNPDPTVFDQSDENRATVVAGIVTAEPARDALLAALVAAGLSVPTHVTLGQFGTDITDELLEMPLLLDIVGAPHAT